MDSEKPQLQDRRDTPPTHWLTPVETPHSNAVLRGPTEDIGDLPSELTRDPTHGSVVNDSAWELSDDQRERIGAGAHIRLGVWQHPIPPLSVEIEPPFCDSCKAAKVYVTASKEYACAGACPNRDPRFGPSPVQSANGSPEKTALEQAHDDFEPSGDEAAE